MNFSQHLLAVPLLLVNTCTVILICTAKLRDSTSCACPLSSSTMSIDWLNVTATAESRICIAKGTVELHSIYSAYCLDTLHSLLYSSAVRIHHISPSNSNTMTTRDLPDIYAQVSFLVHLLSSMTVLLLLTESDGHLGWSTS